MTLAEIARRLKMAVRRRRRVKEKLVKAEAVILNLRDRVDVLETKAETAKGILQDHETRIAALEQ